MLDTAFHGDVITTKATEQVIELESFNVKNIGYTYLRWTRGATSGFLVGELNPEKLLDLGRNPGPLGKKLDRGMTPPATF